MAVLMTLSMLRASAQELPADNANRTDWYVGIDGGTAFGYATFKSFGADKTHIGVIGGAYGGYRFSKLLSAEMSFRLGSTTMTATDCCIRSQYWLGQDGLRYHAPVVGFEGWKYGELKSQTAIYDFAAQLNVNALALFSKTRQSKWTADISPRMGISVTQSDIRTLADDVIHIKGGYHTHFSFGGRLQVSRRIGEHFTVGIYSGLTFFTGRRIDNIPVHIHKSNYLWDSGLRLGYILYRKKKNTATPVTAEVITNQPVEKSEPQPESKDTLAAEVLPQPVITEKAPEVNNDTTDTAFVFPVIYFNSNSSYIRHSEQAKMRMILQKMQSTPNLNIRLQGWCDSTGDERHNLSLSKHRGGSVKYWLIRHGISALRMTAIGCGTDSDETDLQKARRTIIVNREEAAK